MSGDYGYFGDGATGYAHYTQAFNESFKSDSGSSCSPAYNMGSTNVGGGSAGAKGVNAAENCKDSTNAEKRKRKAFWDKIRGVIIFSCVLTVVLSVLNLIVLAFEG